ncbi:MAG: hypothetical protein GEV11_23510 [Streptosporangiales bacterium]|nr:hypothetical protein [Streptosporangiales bacterium]
MRLIQRVRAIGWGRTWRIAAVVLAAIVGGWLGIALGARFTTEVGPVDANFSLAPALSGDTVVNIPPLGRLVLDTHDGPFRMNVAIDQIRPAAAHEFISRPGAFDGLAEQIGDDVRHALIMLGVRALVAASAGAALVGFVVFRDRRRTLWTAGAGTAAVVVAFATAGLTFNERSLAEPRYTGLLSGAPAVVGSAENIVDRFAAYRQQLAKLVNNLSKLYEVTSELPDYEPDPTTIRVLHVSDIHLNPASWNVLRSLVDQFKIQVIIDSGDLSDHGSAPEERFADDISTLGVPYVFVRGNHDSMDIQEAVDDERNAVVLDGDTEEVAGLRIYGVGDPRFTPDKDTRSNPNNAQLSALGATQAAGLAGGDPVDVAVLHDPTQGRPFGGSVPLVLSGHTHRRATQLLPSNTRIMVQGSTGGAGLRGLEHEQPTPYEASVLYFDRKTKRLQAWDDISLGGLGLHSARIERHLEPKPGRPITPSPRPTPVSSVPGATPTTSPSPTSREARSHP